MWIEPLDALLGGPDCRWSIDCGEPRRRVYIGALGCKVEDGHPVEAEHPADARAGGLVADLRGEAPMVVISDPWSSPPTRARIALTGGGSYPGSIPELPPPTRRPAEVIEAAWRHSSPVQDALYDAKVELFECPLAPKRSFSIAVSVDAEGQLVHGSVLPEPSADALACIEGVLASVEFPAEAGRPPVQISFGLRW